MPKHAQHLLLLLAAMAAYGWTKAAPPRPHDTRWMTGESLLKRLEPISPANVALNPDSKSSTEELAIHYTTANVEYVRGYVAAMHDATEGKSWCYDFTYKVPKPDTFWDESRWGLANLPPARLKRNAAELLEEIWRQKWPCPSSQQRR